VLLVSVADKVHNAQSIVRDLRAHGDEMFNRFTGKKDGTLWYYGELAAAYRGCAAQARRRCSTPWKLLWWTCGPRSSAWEVAALDHCAAPNP
jgi:hypothetical protein